MRVLLLGGGGREHALAWALTTDGVATELFTAPGNPGTARLGTNIPLDPTDPARVAMAAAECRADLVVVGPEAPLAAGVADRLRRDGRPVFGPDAAAARIESSKAFAKEVLAAARVPTARSRTFTALEPALAYIGTHAEPLVVKASGLAAGKGAVVCETRDAAARTARAMLAEGALGEAGREIVVEEFLEGEELSVLALTDGERIAILPPAQDHKRLGEGDTGPNTGGMGAYTPVGLATPALLDRVRREVLAPVLAELARRGAPYSGVLYAGLMLAPDGTPNVLEFNCRFGDPETQAILPVLPRGAMSALADIALGRWRPAAGAILPTGAAVTTVLAARGYPERPEKGAPIALPDDWPGGQLVFHAGTARDAAGRLVTAGGRVLNVTGLGPTIADAAAASRAGCERIAFEGKVWRTDIAWREIRRAGAA